MTPGMLNTCTSIGDTIWAAGSLGTKGCIFNTEDLSSIEIFPQSITQIRSDADQNLLVAIDCVNSIYLRGGSTINSVSRIEDRHFVKINSVADDYLLFSSEVSGEYQIVTSTGATLRRIMVHEGNNKLSISELKPGVYFLGNEKFIVR